MLVIVIIVLLSLIILLHYFCRNKLIENLDNQNDSVVNTVSEKAYILSMQNASHINLLQSQMAKINNLKQQVSDNSGNIIQNSKALMKILNNVTSGYK